MSYAEIVAKSCGEEEEEGGDEEEGGEEAAEEKSSIHVSCLLSRSRRKTLMFIELPKICLKSKFMDLR